MKTKEEVLEFISDKRVSDKTVLEITKALFIHDYDDIAFAVKEYIDNKEILTTDDFINWFNEETPLNCSRSNCVFSGEECELLMEIDKVLKLYDTLPAIMQEELEDIINWIKDIKKDIIKSKKKK